MGEPSKLARHCVKIGSGATPRGGKDAYLQSGPYSLIRSQNVYNDRFSLSGLAFISKEQADALSNVEVMQGDVLVNITGDSVARVCQVDPVVLPARVNQHVAIVRPNNKTLDSAFLRYWFVTRETQNHLLALASAGATRPALTKAMLENLTVPDVGIDDQRAIAAVLSALDDKIELNRRMNETLEASARALFRDWFVDFGPTRAKMAGAAPYLAPDLWSLFADALDDDGKPDGWEPEPLTDFFDIIGGGTPKTSVPEFWDGDVPWFSVVDTPSAGSVFVVDTEKTITQAGVAGSSARIIDEGTTIISARGTVGNLAIAARPMTFNQSCYALAGKGEAGSTFVYLAAQNMVSTLKAMSHGSVFSTITRDTFHSITMAKPSPVILSAFESAASYLFDQIKANVLESCTLAETRDLLLPKLMSGEIRVAQAEKLAGDCL